MNMKICPVYFNQINYISKNSNQNNSAGKHSVIYAENNAKSANYPVYSNINFRAGADKLSDALKSLKKCFNMAGNNDSLPLKITDINLLNNNKKIRKAYHIYQMTLPGGSKGLKTPFQDLILSDKFYQCAGLGIVDKKNNQQFMGHIFNKTYIEDIAEQLLEVFDKKLYKTEGRLEIYILPGIFEESKYTVKHILKALKMIDEKLPDKVRFVHFSNKDYRCLGMHKGRLFATNDIHSMAETNPDTMCYFKNPDALDINFMDWLRYKEDDTLSELERMRIYRDYKKEIK